MLFVCALSNILQILSGLPDERAAEILSFGAVSGRFFCFALWFNCLPVPDALPNRSFPSFPGGVSRSHDVYSHEIPVPFHTRPA